MKKRSLKAIFLGLLARRRAGDKSSADLAATGAPQDGAAARSRIEPAPSDQKVLSARAETISATGDDTARKPPDPPADWLAKRSSGPPSHWVERVRLAAPELLQDQEMNDAVATTAPQPSRQVQQRPAQAPPQLQRLAPPLRLQRPAQAPVSMRSQKKSGGATLGRARPEPRDQEPPAPSSSVDAQNNDAGLLDQAAIPYTDESSRLANDSGTIWQIVPRISAVADRATESPQMSPRVPLKIDRTVAVNPPEMAEPKAEMAEPKAEMAEPKAEMAEPKAEMAEPKAEMAEPKAEMAEPKDKGAAVRVVLPPDNVRRPSEMEPHNPSCVDPIGLIQSNRNSKERESPRVEHLASGMTRSHGKQEAPLQIPIISAAPTQITEDRRATSYDVSAGRWPALFESSHEDYFDNLMAVLREVRHNRRLAREQGGVLWSE